MVQQKRIRVARRMAEELLTNRIVGETAINPEGTNPIQQTKPDCGPLTALNLEQVLQGIQFPQIVSKFPRLYFALGLLRQRPLSQLI